MLSKNAITVLQRRYLKKDDMGNPIEEPEAMFRRVAESIAIPEKNYGKSDSEVKEISEKFYEMMINLEFLPNSPTLMNAGRELGQLSACFVLPVEDSMEGIFETIKNTALIHKTGGGTGFSFSRLRPANDIVQTTHGVSSGPISFMEVFNIATETIKQGGTRRGANMAILRVDHPNILDFITCKKDNDRLNNFNISVALTEKFMEAVELDEDYELINPRNKEVVKKLNARKVFEMIVNLAWKNGEPGIIFLDRINRDNPTPELGEIESTNPCGEQPLLPYESCNLGSINLSKLVNDVEGTPVIDFEKFRKLIWLSVRFLDNVIDVNKYPLPIIEQMTKGNRKIGLGVMGFADMLIKLNIPYNSREGIETGEKIISFIKEQSYKASSALAIERGNFPNYGKSKFKNSNIPLRNATLTTIAPTGTLSIIADCSSGIEPIFAISYFRNVMDNDKLIEVNPLFLKIAKDRGFYSEALMEEIAQKGSVKAIDQVPEDIKKIFVTSHDISPEWHIRMQATFQKYVDNAVSKTVNFPRDTTPKHIEKVYILAYKLGCKGVTVYRDGSRDAQVLNIGKDGKKKKSSSLLTPRPRPAMTRGATMKNKIGCGNLYVTVNSDENGICEVFTNTGRAGGCPSQSEATSRLISLALRSNVDISAVVEQLRGIRCLSCIRKNGKDANGDPIKVLSCPDAIGRAIEHYLSSNGNKSEQFVQKSMTDPPLHTGPIPISSNPMAELNNTQVSILPCPDCGNPLEQESGCIVCRSCGFSQCH